MASDSLLPRKNLADFVVWRDGEGRNWTPREDFERVMAERDRYRAALERIANGDVPGTGGYLSVQRFAREALDG